MKKSMVLALVLASAAVPLTGCGGPSAIEAALGETFDVPIHRNAVLPAEGLRLTFQEVNQDSRCPTGVQCVTAGEATYTVRFTKGGAAESVIFNELGGGGQATATFLDYVVNASLMPYPEQPDSIAPEDYVVRLTITRPPVADAAPEDAMAAMYASVVRRLLTSDNNHSTLDLTAVYLVYLTRDATPIDPMAEPDPHVLSPSLQEKITARLADVTANVRWVPSMAAVPLEGIGSTVVGGGVIVSLGNVRPGDDGTYQVYGGLYVSNLGGTGRVYILSEVDGAWQATGDTGVIWMS